MAHTLESYLVELFPEARFVNEGLDRNKWITKYYKFCFPCNFFTDIESGKTYFVKAGDWKDTINRLKIKANKKG